MKQMVRCGSILFFLIANSVHAFAGEDVTETELKKALIGKTVLFSDGVNVFFSPSGKSTHWRGSRKEFGRYTFSDGLLCIVYSSGYKRCSSIERIGKTYSATAVPVKGFKRPSGVRVLNFRILP